MPDLDTATADDLLRQALALHRAGRRGEAAAAYRRRLELSADFAAHANLGRILAEDGEAEEAEAHLRAALAIEPGQPQAMFHLGRLLCRTGRAPEALPLLRRAAERLPDSIGPREWLGRALLGCGEFEEGWPLFEARRETGEVKVPPLAMPEWRGEPLAGKRLLVWREQGYGDQIMMARFLPRLGAASVTYAGPAALARLLSQTGVDYRAEGFDPAGHDYWTLPFSIPGRLGVRLADLPAEPYLAGRPSRRGGVGVVWRGQPQNANDASRSLPADQGARLLALPGAVSLAPEDTGARDFQDTADIVAGLDLVISVDTSVAHLAGAMGKPVLVLLPAFGFDWRWLCARADSPWYPSARLFRRQLGQPWSAVVDRVVEEARRIGP